MPEEASLVITNSGIPNAVPVPQFIAHGELTLNWADSALYFKDRDNVIQKISIRGIEPHIFEEQIPADEGPWTVHEFDDPVTPDTEYIIVQKATGDLPSLKVGIITEGSNNVSVTDSDIIIGVLEGITTNEIKALIQNDEDANALIYFYNAPGSDGTGIPELPILASAPVVNADPISGDRADMLGQLGFVYHSDDTISEWSVVGIRPTRWAAKSPNLIFNETTERWELLKIADGTIQTTLLPDQAPIP
jgi:hypothetical protein